MTLWSDRSRERYQHQFPSGSLEHYYGDIVRILFIALAVLIGICAPFGGDIAVTMTMAVPAILILVVLAGLTNPHGNLVLAIDAIVSILGVLGTEYYAIQAYLIGDYVAFAVLEALTALFVFALYFSVKTVRAMAMHKIGRDEAPGEFGEMSSGSDDSE